jgi:glutamate dehydrogenase/leucine dehydrogenase
MPIGVGASVFQSAPFFVQELLGSADVIKTYEEQNGRNAVLATLDDPHQGFKPTRLSDGTYVRWIDSADSFKELSTLDSIRRDWRNGLGGAVFYNPKHQTWGFIESHGLGDVGTGRYPGAGRLRSLGGIMLFSAEQKTPEHAMADVVAKAGDMTLKYRRIDFHIQWLNRLLAREKKAALPETGLGGGKGIVVRAEGMQESREEKASIRVASEVLKFMGQHIGGGDQGNGPDQSKIFGENAPYNFSGTETADSKLRGKSPSPWTATGVAEAIKRVVPKHEAGLVLGYGHVGNPLVTQLKASGYRLAGIADANPDAIFSASKAQLADNYFIIAPKDKHGEIRDKITGHARELLSERNSEARANGSAPRHNITLVSSVEEIVTEKLKGKIGFYSDNAQAHGITEGLARSLVANKIRYVMGAANNQAATPEVAGILQRGGAFYATPHNINSGGATVVLSDLLKASDEQLRQLMGIIGDDVKGDYRLSLQGKTPEHEIGRQDMLAWNKKVDAGTAIGGKFDIPVETYRSTAMATIGKIEPIGGGMATALWTLGRGVFTTHSSAEYWNTTVQMLAGLTAFMAGEQILVSAASAVGLGRIAFLAPILTGTAMGMALDPRAWAAWDQGRYGDLAWLGLKHLAIEGTMGGLYSLVNRSAFSGMAFGLSHLATAGFTLTRPTLSAIARSRGLIAGMSTLVGLELGYDATTLVRKYVIAPLEKMI